MADKQLINKIARRGVALSKKLGHKWTIADATMDIQACNAHCPLDLEKLLAFDDFNFGHDVFGINKHLNRDTYELENCFLPRCAK